MAFSLNVIPAKAGIHILQNSEYMDPAFVGVTVPKQGFVYILASGKHGTLYIGVTSDLMGRLHQHREGLIKGFSSRYGVTRLVYYESFDDMVSAIAREKQLKKWNRDWKLNLIEVSNPEWVDLAEGLGFGPTISKR